MLGVPHNDRRISYRCHVGDEVSGTPPRYLVELRGVLPTFGSEAETAWGCLQAAPTQPWRSKRLLPEVLRGGSAVHSPLRGPCVHGTGTWLSASTGPPATRGEAVSLLAGLPLWDLEVKVLASLYV